MIPAPPLLVACTQEEQRERELEADSVYSSNPEALWIVKMARFVSSRAVVLLLVASLAAVASAAPKPSDWHVCGEFCASLMNWRWSF